jgi:threonine aldolase
MNFRSDNTAGASDKVLAALIAANGGAQAAYGADEITRRVEKQLCDTFEHEVAVFLVATGTAANSLGLSCVTPPWGAVICHAEAHICVDECGAPEFLTGGAKIVGLPGMAGKLEPATVARQLATMPAGVVSTSQPAALSISQATEAGTVYSRDEIAALSEVARSRKLAVHMDGARFANALVALDCSPAQMTWKQGVDLLSFGATKNGCLAAEAVIIFDKARATEMAFRRKRSGHTLSKGRLLAAQMEAYLNDGHWLDLARRANRAAKHLEEVLSSLPGVRIVWPRQANEVFPIIPDAIIRKLVAAGVLCHPWSPDSLPPDRAPREGEAIYRFVTSFCSSAEEIEAVRRAGQGRPSAPQRIKVRKG